MPRPSNRLRNINYTSLQFSTNRFIDSSSTPSSTRTTNSLPPKISANTSLSLIYIHWLRTNNKKEALANFTSIFEQGTYSEAIVFMVVNASEVYDMLTEFVKQL